MTITPEALDQLICDEAAAIAGQAMAISQGTLRGPRRAAVLRIKSNVATLLTWVEAYDALPETSDV